MLIQKTFHLQMAKETAKEKLSNLRSYHHQLVGVEKAVVTADGMAHFQFHLPCGFRGRVDLAEISGANPAQTLFQSRGGNLEVFGVLEYFEIKPNLTEVVLTLDYTIDSLFFRAIDYLAHSVDRFLNRQLECVEAYYTRSPAGLRADRNLAEPINGFPLNPETDYPG